MSRFVFVYSQEGLSCRRRADAVACGGEEGRQQTRLGGGRAPEAAQELDPGDWRGGGSRGREATELSFILPLCSVSFCSWFGTGHHGILCSVDVTSTPVRAASPTLLESQCPSATRAGPRSAEEKLRQKKEGRSFFSVPTHTLARSVNTHSLKCRHATFFFLLLRVVEKCM